MLISCCRTATYLLARCVYTEGDIVVALLLCRLCCAYFYCVVDALDTDPFQQLYSVIVLIAALKPHGNGPSCSNTLIGTLAVDEWAVTLVQREGDWVGPQPTQAPPRCTKCNSPSINGQCTNFVLFDVAL